MQTAQGERVSIARSEQIEAGAMLRLAIKIRMTPDALNKVKAKKAEKAEGEEPKKEKKENPFSKINPNVVVALLNEGETCGIGQWRNSGHGQFTWKLTGGDAQIVPDDPACG